jgi:hypothetical protein
VKETALALALSIMVALAAVPVKPHGRSPLPGPPKSR